MRFVILSRSRFLYTTRRLVAEAKLRRHDVRVASPAECLLVLSGGQPRLLHKGKLPSSAEVVIPHLGATDWDHGLAALRLLERMGVPTLNTPEALALCRDRFQCAMALGGLALPVPPTALVPDSGSLATALETLGGFPLQLRPVSQRASREVLIDQPAQLGAISSMAWAHGSRVMLQRVVGAARELRIYVAGDDILGAVLRRHQWTAPRGVKAGELTQASEALQRLALRAVKGLGLRLASVDIVETHTGPQIVEVDAMPVLRGIHKATREAVISAMIRQAEALGVSRIPM